MWGGGGEEEGARSPHKCLPPGTYKSGVPAQWWLSCWGCAMKAEGAGGRCGGPRKGCHRS